MLFYTINEVIEKEFSIKTHLDDTDHMFFFPVQML